MANLVFYDDTHEYSVDGVRVPGVSEIIRFMAREIYKDVAKWRMEEAAERGTLVHACCETLDKTGACEVPNEISGYVAAYASFLRSHRVEWRGIEKALYHPQLLYAGTIDRYGILDDIPVVLDIKTNAQPNYALVDAQLGGYGLLANAHGFTAQKHACLQLRKNGAYRLIWHDTTPELFMTCYDLHQALQPRKRGRNTWSKSMRKTQK